MTKRRKVSPPWPASEVTMRNPGELKFHERNSRTHTKAQIDQIQSSIKEFGFTIPVLVDEDGVLLAGHARTTAAIALGLKEVPVMVATGWSDMKKRAYIIADNKLALNAGWDMEILAEEFEEIQAAAEIDIDVMGFQQAEIDHFLGGDDEKSVRGKKKTTVKTGNTICQLGDIKFQVPADLYDELLAEFRAGGAFAPEELTAALKGKIFGRVF